MSVVILISGRGSNMRALVEAGVPVAAVIANHADAAGVEFARSRRLPVGVVAHTAYPTRERFDEALAAEIDRHSPRLVALAGFMRILTPAFTRRYEGRLLNIHPSLLPAFPGLQAQKQAFEHGVKVTGCTVQPWIRTPASSARACVCRPGKAGSRDGWMLSSRPS